MLTHVYRVNDPGLNYYFNFALLLNLHSFTEVLLLKLVGANFGLPSSPLSAQVSVLRGTSFCFLVKMQLPLRCQVLLLWGNTRELGMGFSFSVLE